MSKRAEERALKAYPNSDFQNVETRRKGQRKCFVQGYEQAEKDLALTLEDIVRLDCLIMNMVGEGYNDGYKTRPFYEEVLRRFNEQREKK